ncbi:MAG: hypothetical protein ABFD12_09940 [Syntrophorhabdus sp.]
MQSYEYRASYIPTLSYDEGCHPREVKDFLAKNEPDKYVVFYTRHTALSGKTRNKIVGYFKVGRNITPSPVKK